MGHQKLHIPAAAFGADVAKRSQRGHIPMQAGIAHSPQYVPVRAAAMLARLATDADRRVRVGEGEEVVSGCWSHGENIAGTSGRVESPFRHCRNYASMHDVMTSGRLIV